MFEKFGEKFPLPYQLFSDMGFLQVLQGRTYIGMASDFRKVLRLVLNKKYCIKLILKCSELNQQYSSHLI